MIAGVASGYLSGQSRNQKLPATVRLKPHSFKARPIPIYRFQVA